MTCEHLERTRLEPKSGGWMAHYCESCGYIFGWHQWTEATRKVELHELRDRRDGLVRMIESQTWTSQTSQWRDELYGELEDVLQKIRKWEEA